MMRRRLLWSLFLLALLLGATFPAVADHKEKHQPDEGEGDGDEANEGTGGRHGDGHDDDGTRGDGEGRDDKGEDDEGDKDEGERGGKGKHREADRKREAQAAVRLPPTPRVQLRQDVDATGGSTTYTVAVRNAGGADAPAVVLAADLPAGDWTSPDPDCAVVGDRLTCDLGRLAVGEQRVVEARGTADAALFPAVVQAVTPLSAG